ncbi:MAG: DNA/RNA nuclease SfsA [Candidatus Thorarchaeota archaeon]|nr:DNA/RNA nuclease SfsA [Candidatus Thorarchaeota archaeon]
MELQKGEIVEAQFLSRPNRFLGIVGLKGNEFQAFIPNPGRMEELMIKGKTVYLRYLPSPKRKTDYDLIVVKHRGILVSIDSRLPNQFVGHLLEQEELPSFSQYCEVKSEPSMFGGRFDFRLYGGSIDSIIEVKSCTLVNSGVASFPDAPTKRGARHMMHLVEVLHEGIADRACVIFVIQRPDATVFTPNDRTDPKFGKALRDAHEEGVEIMVLLTKLENWKLELLKELEYNL